MYRKNNDYHNKNLNCRYLETKLNHQNNTSTEQNDVKDTDENITNIEKDIHNQTVDGEGNTVTVVLTVLVLLLIMLLIGVVIVHLRKTRKICYQRRGLLLQGIMIYYLTTKAFSPFLFSRFSDPLKKFLRRLWKQTFSDFCRYIIVLSTSLTEYCTN